MKKVIIIVLFIIGCIGLLMVSLFRPVKPSNSRTSPERVNVSPAVKPAVTADPVTLEVPKLGIIAPIEYVGMDAKGNMDIPKKDADVAWFRLGYVPGTKGNAVIAGHLDTKSGAPAIFYELNKLEQGDKILVVQQSGKKLTFIVTAKHIYAAEAFPLVTVFGPAASPHLNLITCEGTYSSAKHAYSHRTVISSVLSNNTIR